MDKTIEFKINVKDFFKKGTIRKIANKTGFIKRKRKLDAFDFFLSLTFGSLRVLKQSE